MLVLKNDYEMLKVLLQSPNHSHSIPGKGVEFYAKDNFNRNACDLALELGYHNLHDLMQSYGGYAQVHNLSKRQVKASPQPKALPPPSSNEMN